MALLPLEPWHVAPRVAAGLFILNSGLSKRGADPEAAAGMHGMAATAYPMLGELEPTEFAAKLSKAEIGLGAALLTPFVPTGLAGAALTAFGAGLVGLYLRVPGMRQEGSLKPTQQGNSLAKDVWLLGMGLGLLGEARARRRRSNETDADDR